MRVIINGQPETIYPRDITLRQLLSRLGKMERIISVFVNDLPVSREEWRYKVISDSDRVDYV